MKQPVQPAVQISAEQQAISRSVFKVMLGGMLSLSFGLINQMVIAAYFGASAQMDAYLTALVIPDYLQSALLGGLAFVFIPAFVKEKTSGKEGDAWNLVGTFFWIVAVILILGAFLGSFLSREIISLSAPGFGLEKSDLAARMLSILMFSVPFAGLSSFTVGIQNARGSFFWPSIVGAVNSLWNVIAIKLLIPYTGPMALAWGYVVAIFMQCLITAYPVLRHGWKKLLPLNHPRVIEMARLIFPFILFGLLTRGMTIFERFFASTLPTGEISYLGYASKFSSILVALLASGIASVIFPSMARAFAMKGNQGLGEKTEYGLRLTFAIALPAILIAGSVAVPAVKVLFERGIFRPVDTLKVAQIVLIIMLGDVLFRMIGNIISRTFYVIKNTFIPPLVSAVSIIVYIALGKFVAAHWGYTGLAWARSLQQGLNIFLLCAFLFPKMRSLLNLETLKSISIYFLGAIGSYLCGWWSVNGLIYLPALVKLALGTISGSLLYALVLYCCDRHMLVLILEMIGVQRIIDLGSRSRVYLARRKVF